MAIVKFEGAADLLNALEELPKATQTAVLRRTLIKAAEPMREAMAEDAPDNPDTGYPDLHTQIFASTRQKGGKRRARQPGRTFVEVSVGPEAKQNPKAMFMEFGTFKDEPRFYMTPAFNVHKTQALGIIKAELGNEIERSAERLRRKGKL